MDPNHIPLYPLTLSWFGQAVCGDKTISSRYWVQDCSAATENLLLAATTLGLGAVWLGVHPREERALCV